MDAYIYGNKKIPTQEADQYLNRAFLYGDGFFESMRFANGKIYFMLDHYDRILKSCSLLKLSSQQLPSSEDLELMIKNCLHESSIQENGRIRIVVFRDGKGLYTPNDIDNVKFIIQVEAVENSYQFNANGIVIDVYLEQVKASGKFSQIKSISSLLYVMAGIYAKENNLDELILLNEHQKCIEGYSSNLFIVKDKTIFTPLLTDGCIDGVFRKQILKHASSIEMKYTEQSLHIDDVLNADEVWFTSAFRAIVPVKKFKDRLYSLSIAKKMFDKIIV